MLVQCTQVNMMLVMLYSVYPHLASLKNNEKPGVDIHSGTKLKNPVWIYNLVLLVDKQKVPYLYKTTSKEFEFLHKNYATAVAIATMTFQDGGYFGFKVI